MKIKERITIKTIRYLEKALGKLWKRVLPKGTRIEVTFKDSQEPEEVNAELLFFNAPERKNTFSVSEICREGGMTHREAKRYNVTLRDLMGPVEDRRNLWPEFKQTTTAKGSFQHESATFPLSTVE